MHFGEYSIIYRKAFTFALSLTTYAKREYVVILTNTFESQMCGIGILISRRRSKNSPKIIREPGNASTRNDNVPYFFVSDTMKIRLLTYLIFFFC